MVRRDLPQDVKIQINELVHDSVAFAFENPKSGLDYIRMHAQEMEEAVMYQHIELYVNAYSQHLGVEGRNAVQTMFDRAAQLQLIPATNQQLFLL